MGMDVGGSPADAKAACAAFQAEASQWLNTRADACVIAGLKGVMDVACLGALWHMTGGWVWLLQLASMPA